MRSFVGVIAKRIRILLIERELKKFAETNPNHNYEFIHGVLIQGWYNVKLEAIVIAINRGSGNYDRYPLIDGSNYNYRLIAEAIYKQWLEENFI